MAKKEKKNGSLSRDVADFLFFIEEMEEARARIESYPENQEYTMEDLNLLDEIRCTGLALIREVEAVFEDIESRTDPKRKKRKST